jgi:hypothetical protein
MGRREYQDVAAAVDRREGIIFPQQVSVRQDSKIWTYQVRLRRTLETDKVPWFEDHTNVDATLTVRNAIRAVLQSPFASSQDARCDIVKSVKDYHERSTEREMEDHISWFLSQCEINFIHQSCTIDVYIPARLMRFPKTFMALVLHIVGRTIGSFNLLRMQNTQLSALEVIWDLLCEGYDGDESLGPKKSAEDEESFSNGSTPLEPEGQLQPYAPIEQSNRQHGKVYRATEGKLLWSARTVSRDGETPTFHLRCSRRPFMKAERSSLFRRIHNKRMGEWILWDDRFWLRCTDAGIVRAKGLGIVIGPPKMADITRWRESMDPSESSTYEKERRWQAPDQTLLTVPAVYTERLDQGERVHEGVDEKRLAFVGLPTFQSLRHMPGWEWRVKRNLEIYGEPAEAYREKSK